MKISYLKKIKIPTRPGVYFFMKGKEILYIGKATELKSRTKSYFSKDLIETRGPVILEMVFKADKIKWIVTDSVLEALILEAELIKKHQPKYNTKEKDDKSFNFVCITNEDLPKVVLRRGRELQEKENFLRLTLPRVRGGTHTTKNSPFLYATIFGPYPHGAQLREALKIIRKIFPFLDDKSKNYEEFYRQINLVPDTKDTRLYKENIKNIKLFFQGKKKKILQNLKKEMKSYAKNKEFEKAGEIKRQIFALNHINDVSLIKDEQIRNSISGLGGFRIEAYDVAHMSGRNMVGVMTVVDLPAGRQETAQPAKNEYRKFKIKTQKNTNDTGALAEVLERRFKHSEWRMPNMIVVDGGTAQINTAKKVLANLHIDIPVLSVLKDERHRPKDILGSRVLGIKHKSAILLANSEAHRFAIAYHKDMRNKNFITTSPRLRRTRT